MKKNLMPDFSHWLKRAFGFVPIMQMGQEQVSKKSVLSNLICLLRTHKFCILEGARWIFHACVETTACIGKRSAMIDESDSGTATV